jgi:S2P endopeptidase
VIEIATSHCLKASDCPASLHCFKPSLENSTKLVRVHRSKGNLVLFLGHPADVYHSVKVTDFITFYKFFPSSIPDSVTKMCHFITIFSSGIAILNIIPCFYFDGQSIICTLLDIILAKKVPLASVRHAISLCLTLLGSFILIVYIFVMLFTAF